MNKRCRAAALLSGRRESGSGGSDWILFLLQGQIPLPGVRLQLGALPEQCSPEGRAAELCRLSGQSVLGGTTSGRKSTWSFSINLTLQKMSCRRNLTAAKIGPPGGAGTNGQRFCVTEFDPRRARETGGGLRPSGCFPVGSQTVYWKCRFDGSHV